MSNSAAWMLFCVVWVVGGIAYCYYTTESQRFVHLGIVWILMLLPSIYWLFRLLFD